MSKLILIAGTRGSGKNLCAIRECYLRWVKHKAHFYTNFPIKMPHTLLKPEHFITEKETITAAGKTGKPKPEVNWNFWLNLRKEHDTSKQPFDIIYDEAHQEGLDSRRSQSSINICYSNWIAQSRKIVGESKGNCLYFISQTLDKIDKRFRDLADEVWLMSKIKTTRGTIFITRKWKGISGYSAFYTMESRKYPNGNMPLTKFIGEPIFKKNLYDTEWVIGVDETKQKNKRVAKKK